MATTPRQARRRLRTVERGARTARAPRPAWSALEPGEHAVQFYQSDAFLIAGLARYVAAGLRAGEGCIVLATADHLAALERRLAGERLDLAAARVAGRYLASDAAELLAEIMADGLDGEPDAERFRAAVEPLLTRAAAGGRHVRAYGELVALLAADGNLAAARRLEQLWNILRERAAPPFALCCGYTMASFADVRCQRMLVGICGEHSRVFPDESYAALTSEDERLRAIALWQQRANALEREVAERERLERGMREFLGIASHELRTPVASIKSSVQASARVMRRALDDGLTPEAGPRLARAARLLDGMNDQADRLTRFIADLLDVTHIEAGTLEIQRAPVDLTAVVRVAAAGLGTRWPDRRLVLALPDHPVMVVGDADRLGQVVDHLLTNALKYSPEAAPVGVELTVTQGCARLAVTDTGPGLSPAQQSQIFRAFGRVEGIERQSGSGVGLGLGLFICKALVERHEGRLGVESAAGQGATFWCTLPLAAEAHV